jgi:predicted DNA-binding transcriptional regulator YafY
VELPYSNLDALVSWSLEFGDRIEIVSPPEARAALLERLSPAVGGRL